MKSPTKPASTEKAGSPEGSDSAESNAKAKALPKITLDRLNSGKEGACFDKQFHTVATTCW